MIKINTNIAIEEKFSILLSLPKKCGCTVCTTTKNEIKSQMSEKEYIKVCTALGIS